MSFQPPASAGCLMLWPVSPEWRGKTASRGRERWVWKMKSVGCGPKRVSFIRWRLESLNPGCDVGLSGGSVPFPDRREIPQRACGVDHRGRDAGAVEANCAQRWSVSELLFDGAGRGGSRIARL